MPSSSILLLDTDAALGPAHHRHADAGRLSGHRRHRSRRGVPPGPRPPSGDPVDADGRPDGGERLHASSGPRPRSPRSRSCVSARSDDVEERIAFLDRRCGRRDGQAVRCARARGSGRGPAAALPAHERVGDLDRGRRSRRWRPARQAHRRGVQPQGRRGDHDHRGEPRPRPGAQGTRQGRASSTSTCSSARSRRISISRPRQTLADVVRDDSALREAELLRTYATRHDTGLHVLAAPASPETSELVTAEHVGKILTIINETYDTVVVDAGSELDDRTMTVFEHASETVVLPVYPEIAALKAVHSLLDYLTDTGLGRREGALRAQQHVRQGDPQAAGRRERPRDEDLRRAAVRPVPVPQGRQRGDPDRPGCAPHAARGAAAAARDRGVRRGQDHRTGRDRRRR